MSLFRASGVCVCDSDSRLMHTIVFPGMSKCMSPYVCVCVCVF